jgi:hypothetical protein
MTDIMDALERDERAMERIAAAMEAIAESLVALYKLQEARFDKEFPVKREPQDATVTHVPTSEDELKASQGASSETLEEWIGPRETGFLETITQRPRTKAASKLNKK